jgi:type 2 lantibiotic biosynthesis protein LanM
MYETEINSIVARSSRISEDISLYKRHRFSPVSQKDRNYRFTEWCRVVADGDISGFLQRLQKLEVDEQSVLSILSRDRADIQMEALPSWAVTLTDVLNLTPAKFDASLVEAFTNSLPQNYCENPPPFWEVLIPFAMWANQQLASNYRHSLELLTTTAINKPIWHLLEHLSWVGSRVFALRLNICRELGQLRGNTPEQRYRYFVEEILGAREGILDLFIEYPVLARLLSTSSESWLSATTEILARLEKDQAEISGCFFDNKPIGRISDIDSELSDSHCGHRTVSKLVFESGFQVIYKPRSLDAEILFQRILAWLNRTDLPLQSIILKTLPRDEYGWIQSVSQEACSNKLQISSFYQRHGVNLFLAYMLGATDLHCENIVAHGAHPVLVDLETILHPSLRSNGDIDEAPATDREIAYSILDSGLLPSFTFGDSGLSGYDMSGLGGIPGQTYPIKRHIWINRYTDQMRLAFQYVSSDITTQHLPQYQGEYHLASDHIHEIAKGFGQISEFVIQNRIAFREKIVALTQEISTNSFRYVHRGTQVYFEILEKSLAPSCLKLGIDREIRLEVLWRNLVGKTIQEHIVQSEIDDLWETDIPIFRFSPLGTNLYDSKSTIFTDVLSKPSIRQLVDRIDSLSDEDCNAQLRFAQTSLGLKSREKGKPKTKYLEYPSQPAGYDAFLNSAIQIGEELERNAVRLSDSVTWIGLEYHIGAQQYHLTPIGYDLYNGTCGIALFLAQLFDLTNNELFFELSHLALQNSRNSWLDKTLLQKQLVNGSFSLGGFTGLGSLIYTYSLAGKLLKNNSLWDIAYDLAMLINKDIVAHDEYLDVVTGAAGCLLSLLHLYRNTDDTKILDIARLCGNHLLQQQISLGHGSAWKPKGVSIALNGMAHGAAGIAYALAELAEITKEQSYFKSAMDAVKYERGNFLGKHGNWPDYRDHNRSHSQDQPNPDKFMCTWCHGATGIGYARLASFDNQYETDPVFSNELDAAITSTIENLVTDKDHLCCGLYGQLDFLLQVSNQLNKQKTRNLVYSWASAALHRRESQGHWALGPRPDINLPIYGLMQGLAGIGWAMMRLACPDRTSSILLLK